MASKVRIILASKSSARRAMLEGAGLKFESIASGVDEDAVAGGINDAVKKSKALSEAKALDVSKKNPEALVLGSDQVLEIEGKILSKAENVAAAKEKLKVLRGKTHGLVSSVSVAQGGKILWGFTDVAKLSMRDVDDTFLETYCLSAGDALISCVGAYAIESKGAWLFSRVEGDYFTVLGMPLLPLLQYLNEEHGVKP